MTFKVLLPGDPEWVARLMGLGPHRRDIHLDARMLAPYINAYKYRAGLALTADANNYIIQPLLINDKHELRHAYNFGGPIGHSPFITDKSTICEHIHGVDEWCRKYDVQSQHATLLPYVVQEQMRILAPVGHTIEPKYVKESVYIDVNNIELRKTTRQTVNKAQGAGVVVKSYPTSMENMEMFFDMYNKTMDRVEAKDHFRFSYQWFLAFAKYVKPELLVATFEGRPEVACLIAYSQQYPLAYYHFAASYNRVPTVGASHMLVLASCEFVKSRQMQYLYLGGGITPDTHDNLLIFKSGFSKLRLPVYQYQRNYHEVSHDKHEPKGITNVQSDGVQSPQG